MIWKRRNPIGPVENEAWLTSHPLSGVLPPISKYRIPFLLPVDKTLTDILSNTQFVNKVPSQMLLSNYVFQTMKLTLKTSINGFN